MKVFKIITLNIALVSCIMINAQSYNDIIRYSQPQFNGTARATSMGGAFSSLGGDFSALSLNPAGIASYRTNEFSFTPTVLTNSTTSYTNGSAVGLSQNTKDNSTTLAFNHVGFVGTYKPMREVKQGIVSTHFAIGYNRNNNFNYRSMARASAVSNSMTDMFAVNATNLNPDDWSEDFPIGWDPNNPLTGLAWGAFLLDDDNGNYTSYLANGDKVNQTRIIDKGGYTGEINLTFGANISNLLLLGGSINFASLNYNFESSYFEQFNTNESSPDPRTFDNFSTKEYLDASGRGINIKIGAILKPTEDFRIGLAYHSPTWYKITEDFGYSINAMFFNEINEAVGNSTLSDFNGEYQYYMNTPGRIIAGASYVIGKKAIVSFDYHRINYSGGKFKSNTDDFRDLSIIANQNDEIKNILTAANNYRGGIEYRINKYISLRGGYAFLDSPFKNEPKDLKYNVLSAGIGYRVKNFFLDVAYKHTQQETSFFNYEWSTDDDATFGEPPITTAKAKDNNFILTMGWKF